MDLKFMKWCFMAAGLGNFIVVICDYFIHGEILYMNVIAAILSFIMSILTNDFFIRRRL